MGALVNGVEVRREFVKGIERGLTPNDIGVILDLSPRLVVRKYLRTGRIKCKAVGKSYRVRPVHLIEWWENGRK
jgi:hypothetical protein